MKEKDEQTGISGGKVFTSILGIIIAINLAVVFINRLEPITAGIASIALILAVMGLTYRVMNRMVTEYNYILTDKKVIFEKVVGRREKPVLDISYEDILYLEPANNGDIPDKVYYFLCNRKAPGRFIMGFAHKHGTNAVIFCPSSKMVETIKKKIG